MERVLFVIEGQQPIPCLLNPETLVFRRQSGMRTRSTTIGAITGFGFSDDPVIATGGGRTELELDLLFDTEVAQELNPMPDSAAPLADVRVLTRPLWNLAENGPGGDRFGGPAAVRFIWGRSWNVLAAVSAVAERLERFDPDGAPQRSWMRLRLRRLNDEVRSAPAGPSATPQFELPPPASRDLDSLPAVEVPVDHDGLPHLRLDHLAGTTFGDPSLWRIIAELNDISDPLDIEPGTVLRMPGPGGGPAA